MSVARHGVAPSSACIEKGAARQLTEAEESEGGSLHGGWMRIQQVSLESLCHLLSLKREEESRSQLPPFSQSFPVFPLPVNVCEPDECFHASWQRDSPPPPRWLFQRGFSQHCHQPGQRSTYTLHASQSFVR